MLPELTLKTFQLSCIRQHKSLFANISFELHSGEMLLVNGANGTGKSSLLRLLTGLISADIGEIYWNDQLITAISTDYFKALHYLGHHNGIKLSLTVRENLNLFAKLHQDHLPQLAPVLSLLQLHPYINTLAYYLSAGQKRRLALAKLWLFPKRLWLLDEPCTALDDMTQQLFFSHLHQHLKNGGMAILSSHHPIPLTNIAIKTLSLSA